MRSQQTMRPWCGLHLQVLHKFLEVFSAFDWDTYALSLQGPIPLSAYPDGQGKASCLGRLSARQSCWCPMVSRKQPSLLSCK